jgi:FtsP/CotA-like multicopper oxidase with cupredoxin domain
MPIVIPSTLSRRSLLIGATGLVATAGLPSASADSFKPAKEFKLVAAQARVSLVGKHHPDTDVWCYDGRVPGPEIRTRQGEPIRVVVENNLAEGTTVHWHGIRLPIAMDGVPGISQPPIRPGESFTYEFTPPDAGTFWYHPHADTLQQLGRGMAGVLIVEEPQPIVVDRDVLWMITDWRLKSDAQIASGFGNGMDAAMSGRVGNTVTINGAISDRETVRAGERVRLRLVNGALARIMALRFEGHRPVIVAIDGQPCEPHEPEGGRVLLGPAMRVDLMLDMQGEPGRRYRVVDDFYDGLSYWLTELTYDVQTPLREHPLNVPLALPRNPVSDPDLATAERHELKLQGGMMGGGAMAGMGGMSDTSQATWAINGMSMTGDGQSGMPPLLTLQLGRSYVLTLRTGASFS